MLLDTLIEDGPSSGEELQVQLVWTAGGPALEAQVAGAARFGVLLQERTVGTQLQHLALHFSHALIHDRPGLRVRLGLRRGAARQIEDGLRAAWCTPDGVRLRAQFGQADRRALADFAARNHWRGSPLMIDAGIDRVWLSRGSLVTPDEQALTGWPDGRVVLAPGVAGYVLPVAAAPALVAAARQQPTFGSYPGGRVSAVPSDLLPGLRAVATRTDPPPLPDPVQVIWRAQTRQRQQPALDRAGGLLLDDWISGTLGVDLCYFALVSVGQDERLWTRPLYPPAARQPSAAQTG